MKVLLCEIGKCSLLIQFSIGEIHCWQEGSKATQCRDTLVGIDSGMTDVKLSLECDILLALTRM